MLSAPLVMLCTLAFSCATVASAQKGPDLSGAKVAVLIPDAFPYQTGDAVIERDPAAPDMDVILLRDGHADAATIDYTVRFLRSLRKRLGTTPTQKMSILVEVPPNHKALASRTRDYQDAERFAVMVGSVRKHKWSKHGQARRILLYLKA